MTATDTFAARLAIARARWEDRLGMGPQPDKAFAAALRFGPTYLSGLQRSITPPPHDRVLEIAKLTGTDPGWLTYGDETQAPRLLRAAESSPEYGKPLTPDEGTVIPNNRAKLAKPSISAKEAIAAQKAQKKGRAS